MPPRPATPKTFTPGVSNAPAPPPEDWSEIAVCIPDDTVGTFIGSRGRDAFMDDGGIDDRRLGRELAHAGLSSDWARYR